MYIRDLIQILNETVLILLRRFSRIGENRGSRSTRRGVKIGSRDGSPPKQRLARSWKFPSVRQWVKRRHSVPRTRRGSPAQFADHLCVTYSRKHPLPPPFRSHQGRQRFPQHPANGFKFSNGEDRFAGGLLGSHPSHHLPFTLQH